MSNFNFESYVGGQILMLAKPIDQIDGKKPEIWRRGEIVSIRDEGETAIVELAWSAVKRGGRYFLDDTFPEVAVPLRNARQSRSYSLIAAEFDPHLRLELVYCFTEADDERNVPLARVGEARPHRRTSS